MGISHLLDNAARAFGERPAVSVGNAVLHDYRGFAARVGGLAAGLRRELNLAPGDRVGLWLKNCPQFIETMWACWHAGLCVVPIGAKLHPKEVAYILSDCGARVCFVSAEFADDAQGLSAQAAALEAVVDVDAPAYERLMQEPGTAVDTPQDSPAWIFYTSGTTGKPKGAVLTHRNLLGVALRYHCDVDALDEHDAIVHAAAIAHASGLFAPAFVAKGGNQIVPHSRGFDEAETFDLLEHWSRLTLFGAPTMVMRLADHPRAPTSRLDHLRTLIYGGAPMYVADLKRALGVFGPRLCNLYAQGETPVTGTFLSKAMHADVGNPDFEQRLATVGMARTGVELRVLGPNDEPLACGEVGEVAFRSDVVMAGYWNNPAATEQALRGGWLHTGDLGSLDEHGFLTLRDRSKDLIISGGSNVYPREVEEVLLLHDAVAEVSVIGRPHPEWGEEVVAFVAQRAGVAIGPTEAELDALCLQHIARYKRPKAYFFVDSLPKSANGKVLKTELRRRNEVAQRQ